MVPRMRVPTIMTGLTELKLAIVIIYDPGSVLEKKIRCNW